MARVITEDHLMHYGILRRSGRYPWGSGKDPYQRSKSFMGYVGDLKAQGMSDSEIAAGLGMSLKDYRARRSIEKERERAGNIALAQRLHDKGLSNVAIGERMGYGEGTIRSWLKASELEKASITEATANELRKAVEERTYIDVGLGSETQLGISKTKLDTAVYLLKSEEGYVTYSIDVKQPFGEGNTTIQVLCPPGTTFQQAVDNKANIRLIQAYTEDGGRTYRNIVPPTQIDSDRVYIRYVEDGGGLKDGVIELRREAADLSLGNASYAQVRIGVDGTHYMKGMAIYGDIPDGYDFVYNTTKPKGTPPNKVFKTNETDIDNPFGSTIRQKYYIDADGNKQLSPLNMVGAKEGAGEEGSWATWSRNLSSQVLSKQMPALAKQQLELAVRFKEDEFNEIMSLTNPTIRRKMLEDFANQADADAGHLKAAALPRQNSQVLLPVTSLKDNEVYAPNYRPGENVVLIRHPHGGTFEIPELIVNNKNPEAIRIMGDARDAVGINPKVAARLSGADFDGDAVIVIPNKPGYIKTSSPLKGLESFDTKTSYPPVPGMKVMTKHNKQTEMGNISNLITDMTIKGASHDEIARAVRHSMVVIDAEKHKLNYKQSYLDNGIAELKTKYQGGPRKGASTLISRAGAETRVYERKEGQYQIVDGKRKRVYIDPKTGKKLYEETGRTYDQPRKIKDPVTGKVIGYEPTGKMVRATTKIRQIDKYDDAYKLSSGTVMESIYASHANKLKRMANKARLEVLKTEDIPYNPSARRTFKAEVESLSRQLREAYSNKPRERQALLLTNKVVAAKKRENPDLTPAEIKKIKAQALEAARRRVGANKKKVVITDREWLAIQAGAISPSRLKDLLNNTDIGKVKERAMPRTSITMTPAKMVRARTMLATGHTRSEVADALGISVTTLTKAMDE